MLVNAEYLDGLALDWAVAKAKGYQLYKDAHLNGETKYGWHVSGLSEDHNYWISLEAYSPSTDWAQGGPIIECELIDMQAKYNSGNPIVPKGQWYWQASIVGEDGVAYWFDGPAPLVTAMRCYVASKLGPELDVPDELMSTRNNRRLKC
jgi:hypothetical protein